MHFLLNLIRPDAVLMLFVAVTCLLGYTFPGYRDRANGGFYWLLWLIVGVLGLIAWIVLMFT
jgi:hypothetical protein